MSLSSMDIGPWALQHRYDTTWSTSIFSIKFFNLGGCNGITEEVPFSHRLDNRRLRPRLG